MTITKRKIAAALRESAFSPRDDKAMKVILDVGDVDYYVRRAIELLTTVLENKNHTERVRELTWAISLLAVSKVRIEGGE
jgi:hypothetical protein